ncbi:hypothetical protein CEXT_551851 [Caerostris extrusa]|uniref:Uncharacterized protein n=1 Tax=Caerostris extrusa TaxID=172846 RepID=A0AAV4MA24_CAEEX|nr:hypothetical protein CEXT_551851 [Caerostris extrusa]
MVIRKRMSYSNEAKVGENMPYSYRRLEFYSYHPKEWDLFISRCHRHNWMFLQSFVSGDDSEERAANVRTWNSRD